ncbi:MAG TPA: alpha/beta hydrolase-fold protein [Methylomirabilota bacterium]|nr:alpha/beta hydrolase-fold protein [Methylomirabilota bacterium]
MSQDRFIQYTFASGVLRGPRKVTVYLPPSYHSRRTQRYPVLYLHDGQNVFSTAGRHCCFGWGSWELDRTADQLVAEHRMREVLLVAVENSRFRYQEYRGPAYRYSEAELQALKNRPSGANDDSRYAAYGEFLLNELKPWVDREFRTLTGPRHTGLMGSSLGGICSLALAWEHPDVFGLAASLSGAFQVERTNFLSRILRPYTGAPKTIRVYLDSGTVDFSGGDDGRRLTARVADELRRIGWGADLLHFVDDKPLDDEALARAGLDPGKWTEARTSQHNEFYWRLRAWRPLTFLFPPE